ncbi:hypothetical protein COU00_03490 [Candidatus Falkowbacteria bacterium CG10_big_fil_rev_8_21_14_0_10_43_11]|uniref:Uncharacterized protein n=1 Tax=Candidatus Falkowbacteria bacterium CG10_big_fil_rev_8_21_14_0_10_43_11 TaxID=1974568 RepID=A0A2M6WLD0_9BACT|nr:MAG: hypothetical protein COU00_03490 [Candidatus Falkowbacteria bacterium CG10_big_fil_rev_8_21_14_0_10_43_11]
MSKLGAELLSSSQLLAKIIASENLQRAIAAEANLSIDEIMRRLIDSNGTYTTEFSPRFPKRLLEKFFPNDKREFMRTWNDRRIAEKQAKLIKKYLTLSSPVTESAFNN